VSSDKPLQITPLQEASVDKVTDFLVRFGMTTPALFTLETMRPLSYVGSQFMHILTPAISTFLTSEAWKEMADLLEDRRGMDYVLKRIESADRERKS
jgi:hypothetical protein